MNERNCGCRLVNLGRSLCCCITHSGFCSTVAVSHDMENDEYGNNNDAKMLVVEKT